MLVRPVLISALAVAALTLAGCGSDDSSSTASDDTSTSASPSTSASGVSCDYPSDGQAPAKKVDPPPAEPTVSGKVTATITTTAGDLNVTLDADATPCTVNSFVSLAEQGYYDDTSCHRLTTQGIHVLQCGDPSGTGAGGPGYQFDDELTGKETYPAGTLAMANAGPNTNGSQFFIVYGDTPLDPSYTVFGTVDDAGLKEVQGIAEAGVAGGGADGAPAIPVAIKSVTVD